MELTNTMESNKKITLIIPTAYTPEPYFSNCMKRVKEETAGKNFEIIISEDGPSVTDEMREKYPEGAIVLHHEESTGCGQARKRAQEICTGDYVCYLDSDDLMARGYYELIMDAWEKYPDASCVEFGFNNVHNDFVETIFCDDPGNTTYGNFSFEMVWNKTYKGENVRAATPYYNPPKGMTPAEDLLWNTVYQSLYNCDYEKERKLLLDRIIRNNGLAHSTAADVHNRIKMMEYSLEVARTMGTYSPIYGWITTYIATLQAQARKGTEHCGGYKWTCYDKVIAPTLTPITFKLLNECNANCDYCAGKDMIKCTKAVPAEQSKAIAQKALDAISKWEKLYGLPSHICLTGGEPTLLNPEDFKPIFDKWKDKRFIMYTNGLHYKDWECYDNLVFRVHCISGKVDPTILADERVQDYIYVGEEDTEMFKSWKDLAKHHPKITTVLTHSTKPIIPEDIESCRKVEGVWFVDLVNDDVVPCCGLKLNPEAIGTIEKRPRKCDCTTCHLCTNPQDNFWGVK